MNPNRDPDRLIHAFMTEGATELADEVYDAIRDRIDHTRQRAVIGPWRSPDVNRYLKIALSAAAVLAIAVVGYRQFGIVNEPGPASSGSPAPNATPAAPPEGIALTETFTSERHGVTFSYPDGWATKPATEPWTTSVPDYLQSSGDVVYDPAQGEGVLWIAVASQPIGDATPDAWAAETIAIDDGCGATEPITVDGATGLIGTASCTRAAVTTDGRGYFFWLYTGGEDPALAATYDQAWFEAFLATVQLQPEGAVESSPADTGLPVGSTYALITTGGVRGTVTVPAPGWGGDGGIMVKNGSVDPPDGAGMIVFAGDDLFVYGDPCQWSSTTPATPATTVDEVVAALAAQASRDTSAPVDVTVGGHAGKSITLHVPDDAAYSGGQFTDCDQGYFGSWGTIDEPTPARFHQGPGQVDELWILDVDGVLVVFDTASFAGTPVEDIEEMRAIVESTVFE